MSLHTWLTFLAGVIVICGSPGPNMLQVMSSSVRHGLQRTFFTMIGCFIAVFILIGASVAGVGVFIETFPAAFDVLRYAGAAYLIYLGMGAWRAPIVDDANDDVAPVGLSTPKNLFYTGFMVGISNPKAMLFATAFFPQFISRDASQSLQLTILLATFGIVEFSWYMVYALGGSRFNVAMKKARVQKIFNRFTGSLFVLFGLVMAAKSR